MTQTNKLPQLYSLTAIGIGTFLGSALAAGFMLAANYSALGQRKFASYAIYGSLLWVFLLLLIPQQLESIQLALVLTIAQVVFVLFVAHTLQGKMFASYEEMGGKYFSNWRAVLVGVAASFVLLLIASMVALLFGQPAAPVSGPAS